MTADIGVADLRYRSRGLGTLLEIVVAAPSVLLDAVRILEEEVARIDAAASRFRADSEISRLHRFAGRPVVVSDTLFSALDAALAMAEATDGAVDPTVGDAMCRLGYDRDFSLVAPGVSGELPAPTPVPGWRCVVLDRSRSSVLVPPGVALDLGATAKAWTADRVAARVAATLGVGVLVALGGDVAIGGEAPEAGFAVGVTDRCTDDPSAETVALRTGGLATSGTVVRRWRLGDSEVHHIVDPTTGLPALTPWRVVSVAAASCLGANAAATAAMVMGRSGWDWLQSRGLPARLVDTAGRVWRTAGWPGVTPDRLAG